MHHIHTTNGLVIQSRNHGEANKIIHIFTRDLGLIVAIAQGIRFEKSKLRYNVRDCHFSSFSLVHGKEFWRIVGADELFFIEKNRENVKNLIMSRVSSILLRLVQGEEKHEEIFDCIYNFANFKIDTNCRQEFLDTAESLLVIKILSRLGYVGKNVEFGEKIAGSTFDTNIVSQLIPKRVEINRIINNALRESHL